MNTTDRWDATLYDSNHSFVNQLAAELVDILAPKPGERILDVGCGTGPLTQSIASLGSKIVGVDASASMIALARKNYPDIEFAVMDAATMSFADKFDAVFSNAALHWIKPPEAAAECMFAALKPGGRLVLEMGGKRNVSTILMAAVDAGRSLGIDLRESININYFPGIGEYAHLLEQAGFDVRSAVLFDRPTALSEGESGLRNWIRMFRPAAEEAVPEHLVEAFFGAMEDRCRSRLFYDGVWHADYRRLRVTAMKPLI